MALPTPRPLNRVWVSCYMADASAASSAFCISPVRGEIKQIRGVAYGAITVANNVITAKINGTAITGVSITHTQSGSAAGDRLATGGIPTSKTTSQVQVNDNIEIVSDGAGSTTAAVMWQVEIEVH